MLIAPSSFRERTAPAAFNAPGCGYRTWAEPRTLLRASQVSGFPWALLCMVCPCSNTKPGSHSDTQRSDRAIPNNGNSFLGLQLMNQFIDALFAEFVETGRRFVEQKHIGPPKQCKSNQSFLKLAAGESAHSRV